MIAEQLKKAILQAAIQGKLTEQLPEDGDARDLLKEISKEKERLIKEGRIKKEKSLPEVTDDEISFEIPTNWCWVRLGNITTVKGGKRIPVGKQLTKRNTGYRYIRVSDMQNGTVINTDIHYVPEDVYPGIKNYTIGVNDIYITCAGSIGRVGTIPEEFNGANLTENADKIIPYIIAYKWLTKALESNSVQAQITECITQVGQPKLAIKRIESFIVPLPPISEQNRIVERLEEVLPVIDKLAGDETKLDELLQTFPKKMKDAVLQAAIQGKLTEQLPEDGDARDLLKEIQKEKQRLIREGKIKKEKPLPELTEDEIPFEIPANWCWVRLGYAAQITMGQSPEGSAVNGNTGLEFHQGKIFFSDKLIMDSGQKCSAPQKIAAANSVLICVRAPVGTVNIVDREICIGRGLASINGYGLIMEEYVFSYLQTLKKYFDDRSTGSTFKAITLDVIELTPFPLPPLSEQQRIVKRLGKILPVIDKLAVDEAK